MDTGYVLPVHKKVYIDMSNRISMTALIGKVYGMIHQ